MVARIRKFRVASVCAGVLAFAIGIAMSGCGGRVGTDQLGHGITSSRSGSERADEGECDEQLSSSISAAISPGLARGLSRLRLGRAANQLFRSVLPARVDLRSHERPRLSECLASHARFDRLAGLRQSRRRGVDDLPETAATKQLQRFDRDGSGICFVPHALRVGWPARQSTGAQGWSAGRIGKRNGLSGWSASDTSFFVAIRWGEH